MGYYHVYIQHKTYSSEVRLDLSKEMLEKRVITCYSMGIDIVISGRVFVLSDIERLRISRIDKPSNVYWDQAANICHSKWGESSFEPFEYGLLNEVIATYIGTDVTDDFILGPPGWKVGTNYPINTVPKPSEATKNVFVVYGRNLQAREDIFQFLRAIGLNPIEWSEAIKLTGRPNPHVWEILNRAFSEAHAILVLFTPDDEACLREDLRSEHELTHETELSG